MRVNLERVQELLAVQPAVDSDRGGQPPAELCQGIELEALRFAYSDAERPVLEGASASLPAGACVGLMSPSGSGKSTLVDLLLRFYDPDAGCIRVDGQDLRDIALPAWRARIALVSQDIVLFRGSILDNIRYARPQASRREIESAASSAQLGALLERLPDGLDTPLGEQGARLSGGERQRIAIARALLCDPLLVILDEATSAVDAQTEAAILAEVQALFPTRTRLLISHREAVLTHCDRQLSLVDGRLVVTGQS